MGKVKRLFVCSGCDRPAAQWTGRCPSCGEWGSIGEHPAGTGARVGGHARPHLRLATLAPDRGERRISSGFAGLDRVLGGGLVPGSAVLLAGAPGIGKSTLLLQLVSRMHGAGHSCLILSGEEARGQVASRARRLGLDGQALAFGPGRDLDDVLLAGRSEHPDVLVVDSIHTLRSADSDALPGGPGQVRLCADALIGMAKEQGTALVLIGHVTKDGDLAGPRTLEHAVDAVLTFDGELRSGLRVLTGGKNRFGPEGEVAWFEMTPTGLVEREAGPRLGDGSPEAGCATALALAGRRAFAVEVQALVVPSQGPPRRHVTGLDPRRFNILAAVTAQAVRFQLSRSELYGSTVGGLRLDDPGVDLAIAAALASACDGRPPPAATAFVGEVSLSGTVRPVAGMDQRLSAAAAAGLDVVVGPMGADAAGGRPAPVRVVGVQHVREALSWARRAGRAEDRPPDGLVAAADRPGYSR